MLSFLLDEHISPAVADGLAKRVPSIKIFALKHFDNGSCLAAPDEQILISANRNGLTFVTYDLKTVGPLLKLWAESGLTHAGVIFVDNRSIRSENIGGLLDALEQLWKSENELEWTNRVVFLTSSVSSS